MGHCSGPCEVDRLPDLPDMAVCTHLPIIFKCCIRAQQAASPGHKSVKITQKGMLTKRRDNYMNE